MSLQNQDSPYFTWCWRQAWFNYLYWNQFPIDKRPSFGNSWLYCQLLLLWIWALWTPKTGRTSPDWVLYFWASSCYWTAESLNRPCDTRRRSCSRWNISDRTRFARSSTSDSAWTGRRFLFPRAFKSGKIQISNKVHMSSTAGCQLSASILALCLHLEQLPGSLWIRASAPAPLSNSFLDCSWTF